MKTDVFKDHILDQLGGLDGVTCRAMFGGHGLYRHGLFFGILYKGRLYFKIDDTSRARYENEGMKPFRPKRGMTLASFYEVPGEVTESRAKLEAWAGRAVEAAATGNGKRKKRPSGD